jgi:hypothetical protein
MIQDPHAAVPIDLVAFEREVHFLDTVTLGARTELSLGARRPTAEQDAVARFHGTA